MDAVTAKGNTPASNSPIDISTAIKNINTGSKIIKSTFTVDTDITFKSSLTSYSINVNAPSGAEKYSIFAVYLSGYTSGGIQYQKYKIMANTIEKTDIYIAGFIHYIINCIKYNNYVNIEFLYKPDDGNYGSSYASLSSGTYNCYFIV